MLQSSWPFPTMHQDCRNVAWRLTQHELSTWAGHLSAPVHLTTSSDDLFFRRPLLHISSVRWRDHATWLCSNTTSATSLLLSGGPYVFTDIFLLTLSLFCATLHSWRGWCRKYQAGFWSISGLQFGSAIESLTRKHTGELTRVNATISITLASELNPSWLMITLTYLNYFTVFSC